MTDGLTPSSVQAPYLNAFPYLGVPYSGFYNPLLIASPGGAGAGPGTPPARDRRLAPAARAREAPADEGGKQ